MNLVALTRPPPCADYRIFTSNIMSASPSSRPAAPPARAVEPSSDPRPSVKPSQPPANSPAKANIPAPASAAAAPSAADDKKKDDPAATPTARPGGDDGKKASDSASSKPADKADVSKDTRPASPAAKDGSPPSITPRIDAAAPAPPPAAALPGQPAPPPPSPAADANAASTPAQAPPAPQQACTKPTDCQSKICLAGFCATSSGFALATAPVLPGTTTATLRNGRTVTLRATSGALVDSQGRTYRAASGSGASGAHQTACSDPRCVLPADLVGLQEVDDLSGAPPGGRDLLSDAAIAGIVLALLFVVLFLLLVVPKVRDVLGDRIAQWRNRKDERKQRELRDASTPDFGNEDASAFEKGFTPSASPAGELRGHAFAAARTDGQQQHGSTTIDIGDPEKAVTAWQQQQQPTTAIYHSTNQHYQREEVASFTGAGARRKAISFAADLPCARPAGVDARAGGQRKASPTSQQPRETVLPYTVAGEDEEQRSALMDLRMIASSAMPANHA